MSFINTTSESKQYSKTWTDSYNTTVNKAVNLSGLGDISLALGSGPNPRSEAPGSGFSLANVEKYIPVVIVGLAAGAYLLSRR